MCGRFTLKASPQEIAQLMPGLKADRWQAPRYNIAPSQQVATVLNDGNMEVVLTRWGLIPSWAKDPEIGNRTINARAETLLEKPSFRTPFQRQRCLILADGFYEWKHVPGQTKRVPFYFRLKSGKPFAFAGLWDRWKDPNGNLIITSAIITTRPNRVVSAVHHRMPAILLPEHYQIWLSETTPPIEILKSCLEPYPEDQMECYRVSTAVNNPAVDSPRCIEPDLAPGRGD